MNSSEPSIEDIEIDVLVEAIRRRWGYDFSGYLRASLMRRIRRLLADRGESYAELQHQILRDHAVLDQLIDTVTIQVSDMFRNPPFWRSFADEVVPVLQTYPRARLWVAGAANGEELWSYAVLLAEHGLLSRVRLYATDLNPRAVERIREGTFAVDRVRTFTANWLAAGGEGPLHKYYQAAGGRVRFDPGLLDDAVLGTHNLATDGSFIQAHVISCRNVLIYFDTAMRERALELFRSSLNPLGFLCLGSRESLRFSGVAPHFEELDGQRRIYQRRT